MASVFSQGGYLYISMMLPNEVTGKMKRKKISLKLKDTIANRKIAEKKYLKEVEDKVRSGEIKIPKIIPTFKEVSEEYFKKKRDEGLRGYTVDFYKYSHKKHLGEVFDEVLITEITADDIDRLQTKLLKTLAVKTVKNIRVTLHGVFDLAVKKCIIDRNPFDRVNKIVENKDTKIAQNKKLLQQLVSDTFEDEFDKHKQEAANPFEEAEIFILIETATGQMKNFCALIYLLGGLRPSEAISVCWKHIDFEKKIVYVLGSITGYQTEEEKHLTKTSSSMRKIYISESAMYFLKEQYKITGEFEKEVFLTNKKIAYRNSKSINEQFQSILEKAKLRKRFLYNLRHSYASINLSKNRLPLLFISQQMGHKDASITLQKYSRYVNKETETVDMINNAFKGFDKFNRNLTLKI